VNGGGLHGLSPGACWGGGGESKGVVMDLNRGGAAGRADGKKGGERRLSRSAIASGPRKGDSAGGGGRREKKEGVGERA